jgi:Cdc6-like AAA superfamily ATPase
VKKVVLLLVLCFSGIVWFFHRPPFNTSPLLNSWHTQAREPQKAKDQEEKPNFVRSELTIPTDAMLLDRGPLIGKLKTQLNRNFGRIRTIVLTGIGGSGKTTLVRQYARLENTPVMWEINAETRETLLASFENLAQSLAKTPEEKREIHTIREIKNVTGKETQLIQWVHERLSQSQSWLLCYDNVVSFRQIRLP